MNDQEKIPPFLIEKITENLLPESEEHEKNQQLKNRLMNKIQQEKQKTTIIRATERCFTKFYPGIEICILSKDAKEQSYLLKIAAGAIIPPHQHPITEECIVLEGSLRIGTTIIEKGAYHLAPHEFDHQPITSDNGALIYLHGAILNAQQIDWLSKDTILSLVPNPIKKILNC